MPTPVLRWYRDGKALTPGSSLSIRAYSKESKSFIGLFACEAINCMGETSTFSRVYAKNFASFLNQCGHFPQKKKGSSIKGKANGDLKLGDQVNNRDKRRGSDTEDSGIAEDPHHI